VSISPNISQRLQQAMALHGAGRLGEAEPVYAEILVAYPRAYPPLHLMGLLRYQQGRLDEALGLMEQALAVQPGAPETLTNYARVLESLRRLEEALAALDQALVARPGDARLWSNRGVLLGKMDRGVEALESFDKAVALDGRNAGLRNNRGIARRRMGLPADALADFEQVLNQMPSNVGALLNRAGVLIELSRLEEACEAYDRVLAIEVDNVAALVARGGLLSHGKALGPALIDLERAMACAPDTPYLRGSLLHTRMKAGDWRDFDVLSANLEEAVRAGRDAAEPFVFQTVSQSPANLQTCARAFVASKFPAAATVFTAAQRKPGPIRVGYVCGEFRSQATMLLSAGLYEAHDPTRFEIFAIDNGLGDGSALRRRLEAAMPFVSIATLSDAEAAREMAARDIDILVNLNGYFGGLRMGLFARRPAPIQVNYLGFPGTLGAAYIDYILADRSVLPQDEASFYDERIAWLPDSYQITDDKRARPGGAAQRRDHGLPEQGLVFCNFNFAHKITPDMFALWLRLLQQVPGSVLWLLEDNGLLRANLVRAAGAQGIETARLVFAPKLPPDAHLERLTLADLFLDCLPYNAHTTASDALWAGVPVLTCRGTTFAGRVGASLLGAVGLPELVTESLADYEAMALALARDPERLAGLRRKLAEGRSTAPLFNTAATTRHIETAYTLMLERWARGEPAQSFSVPSQFRFKE
jgi:predicted O-linked N-acetylglucosamine transferase (SPINDLY family)